MKTVWILGDQLRRDTGALAPYKAGEVRVLLVESAAKLHGHRQRLHFVIASMRRFAEELKSEGFKVDYRKAPTMQKGFDEHCQQHKPDEVIAMSPMSYDGLRLLQRNNVTIVPNDQFLCSAEEFAQWAGEKKFKMEDFYRWQRRRLSILMDGKEPAGGRWNFDADNREPPPKDGRRWPAPIVDKLDRIDARVIADVGGYGKAPEGLWSTTRKGALARLRQFVDEVLPLFGPHEDAMLKSEWKLAHSALSPYLNIGLLSPAEVVAAVEEAYRAGNVPIASAEGFIRQVIGWREYVWGLYWLWMPDYRNFNELQADQPLPPSFTGAATDMACIRHVVDGVNERAWVHHIERLMILGNFTLTYGAIPQQVVKWMWHSFIDGAEWVMLPNVIGMALYADGGRMATKPYASSGSYINRMSDYCGDCRFNFKERIGENACPFTTLYWDFLARNEESLKSNHRLGNQMGSMRKMQNLDLVRERAVEIRAAIANGEL